MDKHRDVLGALFLGLGILGIIGMVAVLTVFGPGSGIIAGVAANEADVPEFANWLPAAFGLPLLYRRFSIATGYLINPFGR